MDINAISQLIGSLGFPIAMCSYMIMVVNKSLKENTIITNKMVNLLEELTRKVGVENK